MKLRLLLSILLTITVFNLQAQVVINTFAGDGTPGYSGDGGPATIAHINKPYGVVVDGIGNVYFTDYSNNRIRKIDTFGNIRTIAGTGVMGFSGDGGPATAAALNKPMGIAIAPSGDILFSDYTRIRKVNPAGIISTVAGNSMAGYAGDGVPATSAELNFPWGVAADPSGNIYIADQFNCRVRKINTSGIISTITGTGICFGGGDGGPATAALVQYPTGVACDASGNLYIADYGNNRVRKINPAGIISTIAGGPTFGFSGDGGPSTAAQLSYPEGIATDAAGNIYICDINNDRIRKINAAGIISTLTGIGSAGYGGDGGPPALAEINRSTGVAVGAGGKIFISDNENNRIRFIHVPTHAPVFIKGHTQSLTFCSTETFGIDSLLTVFDIDTGQTETWSVAVPPANGSAFATFTTLSGGTNLYTLGLQYSPSLGYIGYDSFKIQVTDGFYFDTTTIYIHIITIPNPGVITGIDSLCPGETFTFIDTASGGTWSSATPSVATVSGTGLVTGITSGITSIMYTVTNICGTTHANYNIAIKSDCPSGIKPTSRESGKIMVLPNPNTGSFRLILQSDQPQNVHYIITNLLGQKVKEFNAFSSKPTDINLNEPAGVYFISATTETGYWITKMDLVK